MRLLAASAVFDYDRQVAAPHPRMWALEDPVHVRREYPGRTVHRQRPRPRRTHHEDDPLTPGRVGERSAHGRVQRRVVARRRRRGRRPGSARTRELSREGRVQGPGSRRDGDRGQHAGAQHADAARGGRGHAARRLLRCVRGVRGQRRARDDHALRAVLPSGAPREAADRRPLGCGRLRDDELGSARQPRGAVRIGQAGMGQPDVRQRGDGDADAPLHRDRAH